MKKICLFNHKGGVSKTTTSYNIGWMLTNLGKRVLLIDTDSQCNLTSTVLGEDNYEQFYINHPKFNIKEALSPAFDGKPMMIEPAECISVRGNDKLFLLPGSFDLSEYEVSLGVSFTLSSSLTSLKNLPGSFNYLLETTAKKYNVDYVIVDMNPSLSAINQALILSCDYFIVPASPDYFSIMALKSLAHILPKWEKWAISARIAFKDSVYPFPTTTPKFLGTIIQRFNIRNGKATEANREVIEKINETVETIFVPQLNTENMLLNPHLYTISNHCLTQIPDFNTLNALYQQYGIPVFELTDTQLKHQGTVLKQYQMTRKVFFDKFEKMCNTIIEMTA